MDGPRARTIRFDPAQRPGAVTILDGFPEFEGRPHGVGETDNVTEQLSVPHSVSTDTLSVTHAPSVTLAWMAPGVGDHRDTVSSDFQLGNELYEVKNAASLSRTAQIFDTANLVRAQGGQDFIVTRASTALRGLSGPLRAFVASTPGVLIIGCLTG